MIRPIKILSLIAILAFSSIAQAATYELTITNRAPQLLTSPVCIVHSRNVTPLELGTEASEGLRLLAEDGAHGTFASEMRSMSGVRRVVVGDFLSSGESTTIEFRAGRRQRLTCVFGMLVVSNDAFPAVRSIRLPNRTGRSRRVRARVYDAGTEANTESCDDVPGGPCDAHFTGVAENGTIQLHPGIEGTADIDADRFGWRRIAVRGDLQRTQ